MKKKVILIIAALIAAGALFWFFSQNTSEGYVFDSVDSESGAALLVIELDSEDTEGKTQEEIAQLLDQKAAEPAGTYYTIPFINRLANTSFEKGDKVKIYWTGHVFESMPGQVRGTMMVVKK